MMKKISLAALILSVTTIAFAQMDSPSSSSAASATTANTAIKSRTKSVTAPAPKSEYGNAASDVKTNKAHKNAW